MRDIAVLSVEYTPLLQGMWERVIVYCGAVIVSLVLLVNKGRRT
jgi:hypothetical protein